MTSRLKVYAVEQVIVDVRGGALRFKAKKNCCQTLIMFT